MKIAYIAIGLGGLSVIGLGVVMAMTNPSQNVYDEYAVNKLTQAAKNVCDKLPISARNCSSIIDSKRSQIQQIISEKTQRYNLIIASIYITNISIPFLPFSPSCQVETIGIMQNLYTIKAENKSGQSCGNLLGISQ